MDNKEYKWYIYQLIDPRNDEVFYIGKGAGKRIKAHEKETRRGVCSKKTNKIKEIWLDNLEVKRQIIAYCNDEKYAYEVESDWINSTPNLTNRFPARKGLPFAQYHHKEVFDAVMTRMGEFAYWYKHSNGGALKSSISTPDCTHGKLIKVCAESLYNSLFPKFLKDIQKSSKLEIALKNELNAYGVQYGC